MLKRVFGMPVLILFLFKLVSKIDTRVLRLREETLNFCYLLVSVYSEPATSPSSHGVADGLLDCSC